jgi:hypothetical protein
MSPSPSSEGNYRCQTNGNKNRGRSQSKNSPAFRESDSAI